MSEGITLKGAYSPYTTKLSELAIKAWNESGAGDRLGVTYTPVAVAQQVVSGMNYRFFCNAKMATPVGLNKGALITVYAPLNDEARITDTQWVPAEFPIS